MSGSFESSNQAWAADKLFERRTMNSSAVLKSNHETLLVKLDFTAMFLAKISLKLKPYLYSTVKFKLQQRITDD